MNAKFYYLQKLLQQHQAEIDKELSIRHMLNEAGPKKQTRHLNSRVAAAAMFIIVTISLLSLSFLG